MNSLQKESIQRKKNTRNHSTDFCGGRSDGNFDSDHLVKHNKFKKKHRGQISESDNESEDGNDDKDLSNGKFKGGNHGR